MRKEKQGMKLSMKKLAQKKPEKEGKVKADDMKSITKITNNHNISPK